MTNGCTYPPFGLATTLELVPATDAKVGSRVLNRYSGAVGKALAALMSSWAKLLRRYLLRSNFEACKLRLAVKEAIAVAISSSFAASSWMVRANWSSSR